MEPFLTAVAFKEPTVTILTWQETLRRILLRWGTSATKGMGAINWFATQMVVNAATDGLVGAAGAALEASPLATQIG
jgi:hypothetical protein